MATRLQDFREKYPGLNDVDDEKLSKAIHSKYYSDVDFGEFTTRMGQEAPAAALTRPDVTPPTPPSPEGVGVGVGDLARSFGSGAAEGTAAFFEGTGQIERKAINFVLGESNRVLGTDFGEMGNRGDFFARPLRAGAERLTEGVSPSAQTAMQQTTPRGNIFEGEFDFGEDPSLGGFMMQGANVAGQLVPALAGGAATAGLKTAGQLTGLAGVTAAQSGGAALHEESNRIRELPQQDLNRMPGYIDQVAEGKTLDEAREALAVDAGESAFNITAPVGAISGLVLGAGFSRPVQNLMARLVGRSPVARGVATALAEAPLEGVQEVAEGVAQRFGGSLPTGEDRELGAGTAAEFGLGVIGGGIGGAGGAFRRPGREGPRGVDPVPRDPSEDAAIFGDQPADVEPDVQDTGFPRPRQDEIEEAQFTDAIPLDLEVTPTPAQLEQAAAEAPGRTSTRTEVEIDGELVEQPAAFQETAEPVQVDDDIIDTVSRQVEAAYAEVDQPAPAESVDIAIVKDDLDGLEGDELTAEIRQLRDDELLQRAGVEAPITNEETGEFLDPHQARVAQGEVQRETGLELDRRTAGLTDEQVEIMRANQSGRQQVEDDRDPTFEGFFRRGERHKTVLRAQQWAEQTQSQAIYVEADVRNLGGLNAERGTTGADVVLNETGQTMLREMQKIGADKVIPIRRGGDEISFVIIGSDPDTVQTAIDNTETQVDALAEKEGLTDLPHKAAGREPGYGIIGALSEIKPGAKIESIYSLADNAIERRKKGDGQPTATQEIGTIAPGEQAGRVGGGAETTAEIAGTGVVGEQVGEQTEATATAPGLETGDLIPQPSGDLSSTSPDGGVSVAPPTPPALTPTQPQINQASRFARSKEFQERLGSIKGDSIPVDTFTANQRQSLDRVVVRNPEGGYNRADLEALTAEKKAAVPLNQIEVEVDAIDESGQEVTVTRPADEALAEVDQNIKTIRKMRECLLK